MKNGDTINMVPKGTEPKNVKKNSVNVPTQSTVPKYTGPTNTVKPVSQKKPKKK